MTAEHGKLLFRSYMHFYGREESQAMYDRAWNEFQPDERMHARVACSESRVVGLVHFLVHASSLAPTFAICRISTPPKIGADRESGARSFLPLSTFLDSATARACIG